MFFVADIYTLRIAKKIKIQKNISKFVIYISKLNLTFVGIFCLRNQK